MLLSGFQKLSEKINAIFHSHLLLSILIVFSLSSLIPSVLIGHKLTNKTVPDLVSRNRDVVLVRRIFSSGKPRGGREFGMGREWEGDEKGEVSLRVTWGQGVRDPITPRRVSK